MVEKKNLLKFEEYFGEKVISLELIKKTDSSMIYLLITNQDNKYALKMSNKKQDAGKEYKNHKIVFHIWQDNKDKLSFNIPSVHFYDKDYNYYVMEYVKNSTNLQELIFNSDTGRLKHIFHKIGKMQYDYHQIATSALKDKRRSLLEHNSVKTEVESNSGQHFLALYDSLPKDSYRFLLKDFKPTNVLIDEKDRIWLIDFQNINYYAPLYYDFARFIDTMKIFSFISSPFKYVLYRRRIACLIDIFIRSYGENISLAHINTARKIHQKEHIIMKKKKGQIPKMLLLKLLYGILHDNLS